MHHSPATIQSPQSSIAAIALRDRNLAIAVTSQHEQHPVDPSAQTEARQHFDQIAQSVQTKSIEIGPATARMLARVLAEASKASVAPQETQGALCAIFAQAHMVSEQPERSANDPMPPPLPWLIRLEHCARSVAGQPHINALKELCQHTHAAVPDKPACIPRGIVAQADLAPPAYGWASAVIAKGRPPDAGTLFAPETRWWKLLGYASTQPPPTNGITDADHSAVVRAAIAASDLTLAQVQLVLDTQLSYATAATALGLGLGSEALQQCVHLAPRSIIEGTGPLQSLDFLARHKEFAPRSPYAISALDREGAALAIVVSSL